MNNNKIKRQRFPQNFPSSPGIRPSIVPHLSANNSTDISPHLRMFFRKNRIKNKKNWNSFFPLTHTNKIKINPKSLEMELVPLRCPLQPPGGVKAKS